MRTRQIDGQLDLFDTGEPAWRVLLYGLPPTVHDPRCWLDPRHHARTPCSWPADPELARTIEYERVLRLSYDAETGVLAHTVTPDPRYL